MIGQKVRTDKSDSDTPHRCSYPVHLTVLYTVHTGTFTDIFYTLVLRGGGGGKGAPPSPWFRIGKRRDPDPLKNIIRSGWHRSLSNLHITPVFVSVTSHLSCHVVGLSVLSSSRPPDENSCLTLIIMASPCGSYMDHSFFFKRAPSLS